MRKILYYTTFKTIGGGEISLLSLIYGLKRKYKLIVVSPPGDFFNKLTNIGLEVVPMITNILKPITIKKKNKRLFINPFVCINNILIFLKNFLRLYSILKKYNPDVIHTNTLESVGLIIFPAMVCKIPVLWHVRILLQHKFSTIRFYVKLISCFVAKVVAISHAVKDRLIKAGMNPNKIAIVYNPIDTTTFMPLDKINCRKIFNLPINSFIIGSLGRLTPDKGFELVLEATTLIILQHPNTYVLIAGNEWINNYRMNLINYAKQLGIASHLIMLNWQDDAPKLIAALDIMVLASSEKEGFGRTLAEAMACGVPVIGTNVGGISEIIEHQKNGLLIPPGDKKALSRAILILLKHQRFRSQLIENGRKIVVNKFSVNQHIAKIDSIYSNLFSNQLRKFEQNDGSL